MNLYDQLLRTTTAAEAHTRARLYGLSMGMAKYADTMRLVQPNMKILDYVLPRYVTRWNAANWTDWCKPRDVNPESAYLHRPNGDRVKGYTGKPMANMTNAHYRTFISEWVVATLGAHDKPLNGVMLDVPFWGFPDYSEGNLSNTQEFRQWPLNDNHVYARSCLAMFVELDRAVAEVGAFVVPNFGSVGMMSFDNTTREIRDRSQWLYAEVCFDSQRLTYKRITNDMNRINALADAGKRILCGFYDRTGELRMMAYALALCYDRPELWWAYDTAGQGKDNNSIETWRWNPLYDVRAFTGGRPVEYGDGLIRRRFENGYVFINLSDRPVNVKAHRRLLLPDLTARIPDNVIAPGEATVFLV